MIVISCPPSLGTFYGENQERFLAMLTDGTITCPREKSVRVNADGICPTHITIEANDPNMDHAQLCVEFFSYMQKNGMIHDMVIGEMLVLTIWSGSTYRDGYNLSLTPVCKRG